MTKFLTPFAAILAVSGLAGCPRSASPDDTPGTSPPSSLPTVRLAEMQTRIQNEHAERLSIQAKLEQTEAKESRWKTIALLSVSGALVLLIVGVVLGSKARQDHETRGS